MASTRSYTIRGDQLRYTARWIDPTRPSGRAEKRGFKREDLALKYAYLAEEKAKTEGVTTNHKGGKTLLRDFAPYHLRLQTNTQGQPLSKNTVDGYQRLLDRNIIGKPGKIKAHHLGHLQLRHIQPETVAEWRAAVVDDASPDQAAKSYRLLHSMLARAAHDHWIPFNPCQVRAGGREKAAKRPIPRDDDEIQELADAMEDFPPYGPRCRALVLMSGFGGAFRTDEMLSLRRRDVDHKRKRVQCGTKTVESERWVSLPDRAWAALIEHMERFMLADDHPEASRNDWVFAGVQGGRLPSQRFSEVWVQVKERLDADPDLHLYDLRHYALTEMATMGVPIAERMAHCGHVTERMQLRYEKARDSRAEENRRRLSERWSATDNEPPPDNVIPIKRRATN